MNPDAEVIFRRFANKAKLRHFSLLIQLHDLRNMKRAAEALNLSQPAVSLAVAELEKLLGVQLFLRHARGVEPTQVASELVPVARRIMSALGDGSEIVSNVVNETTGFVRIAATPAATSAILHPLAETFARKFPSVHLSITEINAANPLEPISDGACDILCLRQLTVVPENWQFEQVIQDRLAVICGAQNPLASAGNASLGDLQSSRWLVSRSGSIARIHFEELAEKIALPAEHRCGIVTHIPMLTLKLLIRENFLTLIPRSVALPWLREGLVAEIAGPGSAPLSPLGFLWQPETASSVVKRVASEIVSMRPED